MQRVKSASPNASLESDKNCQRSDCLRRGTKVTFLCILMLPNYIAIENKGVIRISAITLGSIGWRNKCDTVGVPELRTGRAESLMTQNNDQTMMEEVVLPEHLLPLGSVLGQGVTALDLCMVLAKIFRVQYTEVALLRLEGGLLRFIFPEHLRTTGSIPLSSKAVAAHTALSKKAEIFNNFARVKHASIFETIKLGANEGVDTSEPLPIQKLMSAPVVDEASKVLGVIQISRKGSDAAYAGADFSREDLHELELAAGILAASTVMREG